MHTTRPRVQAVGIAAERGKVIDHQGSTAGSMSLAGEEDSADRGE